MTLELNGKSQIRSSQNTGRYHLSETKEYAMKNRSLF